MKCPNCGANGKGKYCEYCGTELVPDRPPQPQQSPQPPQKEVVHIYHETERVVHVVDRSPAYSEKSRGVALFLCVFFGWFGGHRFYVGKVGSGLLYLCSFGLCGFGVGMDILMILLGRFKDRHGRRLV